MSAGASDQTGSASLKQNSHMKSEPEILKALETIMNIDESIGVKGCTYGDTQYDSLSGHYGSNEMLNYIKSIIEPVLKKARKP